MDALARTQMSHQRSVRYCASLILSPLQSIDPYLQSGPTRSGDELQRGVNQGAIGSRVFLSAASSKLLDRTTSSSQIESQPSNFAQNMTGVSSRGLKSPKLFLG